MRVALALTALLALAFIACGDDEGAPPPVEGESSITSLGVEIIEIATGDGPVVGSGDRAEVHYTGWLSDGRQFDSSVDRNQTFSFRLDAGEVIAGWDDGVAGMAQGGIRRLIIPPDLAYGEGGSAGSIPPAATLTFDIELISFTQCQVANASPPPLSADAETFTTEGGVQVIVIAKGSNDDPTQAGDSVSMDYTGWLTADGTMFDSSHNRCERFTFTLASGQVIQGWEEGILGMSPGEQRRLIIPPDLAYGDQGSGVTIPPGATLTFDVELIGFGRRTASTPEATD